MEDEMEECGCLTDPFYNGFIMSVLTTNFKKDDFLIRMNLEIGKNKTEDFFDLTGLDVSGQEHINFYHFRNILRGTIDITGWDTSKCKTLRFNDLTYVKKIIGLETLNLENIVSTNNMFYGCWSLLEVDLSMNRFPKLRSTSYMFFDCKSIREVRLPDGFISGKVTSSERMFYFCTNLKTMNMDNWNFSGLLNMNNMFYGCESL